MRPNDDSAKVNGEKKIKRKKVFPDLGLNQGEKLSRLTTDHYTTKLYLSTYDKSVLMKIIWIDMAVNAPFNRCDCHIHATEEQALIWEKGKIFDARSRELD